MDSVGLPIGRGGPWIQVSGHLNIQMWLWKSQYRKERIVDKHGGLPGLLSTFSRSQLWDLGEVFLESFRTASSPANWVRTSLAQCCHLAALVAIAAVVTSVLSEQRRLPGSKKFKAHKYFRFLFPTYNLLTVGQCGRGWLSSSTSPCISRMASWWQQRSTCTLGNSG